MTAALFDLRDFLDVVIPAVPAHAQFQYDWEDDGVLLHLRCAGREVVITVSDPLRHAILTVSVTVVGRAPSESKSLTVHGHKFKLRQVRPDRFVAEAVSHEFVDNFAERLAAIVACADDYADLLDPLAPPCQ